MWTTLYVSIHMYVYIDFFSRVLFRQVINNHLEWNFVWFESESKLNWVKVTSCLKCAYYLPVHKYTCTHVSAANSSIALNHLPFEILNQPFITRLWRLSLSSRWERAGVYESSHWRKRVNGMYHLRCVLLPKSQLFSCCDFIINCC